MTIGVPTEEIENVDSEGGKAAFPPKRECRFLLIELNLHSQGNFNLGPTDHFNSYVHVLATFPDNLLYLS